MYTIAVIQPGKPPERHSCTSDQLVEAVCDVIRSRGSVVTANGRRNIAVMVEEARNLADATGFAGFELAGEPLLTIRPAVAHSDVSAG